MSRRVVRGSGTAVIEGPTTPRPIRRQNGQPGSNPLHFSTLVVTAASQLQPPITLRPSQHRGGAISDTEIPESSESSLTESNEILDSTYADNGNPFIQEAQELSSQNQH